MRISELIILLFITFVALMGCTNEIKSDKNISANNSSNGLWQQIGYGRILELNDSTIKIFDLNEMHCMLTFEEDILDFAEIMEVNEDTLTLKHGIDLWKCTRLHELPTGCVDQKHITNNDPLLNYDVFWQNFKEHYSSFELKNIDWDEVNDKYCPQVTTQTTNLELYLIFEEMISLLNDGHIEMPVPEAIEDVYQSSTKRKPRKYNTLDVFETAESLALLYVDSLRTFNAGMTRWGMVGKQVGYVQINAMLMQADYNLDEGLTLNEFEIPYWVNNVSKRKDEIHRQEEAAGMKATLERIRNEMPQATSFIVDLRFNTGGKDGVAMEIVHHFSSVEGKLAEKFVFEKAEFVNHQDIINLPSSNGFDGPVYLLTSHLTASAAELTVLCSLADEQFIRIGSPTEGIFSSTLDKVLPNGWEYTFSNEIYQDYNGVNYEDIGITPDINIPYSENRDEFLDQLKSGLAGSSDPAIERALQKIVASN